MLNTNAISLNTHNLQSQFGKKKEADSLASEEVGGFAGSPAWIKKNHTDPKLKTAETIHQDSLVNAIKSYGCNGASEIILDFSEKDLKEAKSNATRTNIEKTIIDSIFRHRTGN